MKSVLCPTCGCSLARLGISRESAARGRYNGDEYLFCCQGCCEVFASDPGRFLAQIRDLVVCPGCLAEKPVAATVVVERDGRLVHFCGCPGCSNAFRADPERLLARLEV